MSEPAPHFESPVKEVLPESRRYKRIAVRSIRFDDLQTLVVDVQGEGFSFARILFQNVTGFRVLDEAALLEFGYQYSTPDGWLWEVTRGGWLDLERTRPASDYWLSTPSSWPWREYLIMEDKCISVICGQPPEIRDLGADPP